MNYKEAAEMLAKGRNPERSAAWGHGGSTRVERRGADAIALRLHETDVVTWYADGRTVLDDGGWRTVTTKDRMQYGLPRGFHLFSDRGDWWLVRRNNGGSWWDPSAKRWGYRAGLTISKRGRVTGASSEAGRAATAKMRRAVLAWGKDFTAALVAGKVPPPSGGDCWLCMLREAETGKPWGEGSRDRDHVLAHVRERYYVPSFAVRAVELYGSRASRDLVLAYMLQAEPEHAEAERAAQVRKVWGGSRGIDGQVQRAIVKHTFRLLGMAAR